jgi:hypothetical protein
MLPQTICIYVDCFCVAAPAQRLKLMLSFAVGSLLGDVFCHLLPEVWNYMDRGERLSYCYAPLLFTV